MQEHENTDQQAELEELEPEELEDGHDWNSEAPVPEHVYLGRIEEYSKIEMEDVRVLYMSSLREIVERRGMADPAIEAVSDPKCPENAVSA